MGFFDKEERPHKVVGKSIFASPSFYIMMILLVLFLKFVVTPTRALETSMEPTIRSGDTVLVYKLQQTYSRGDVIMFEYNGKLMIKRIIGEPNQIVQYKGGYINVNGSNIKDSFTRSGQDYGLLNREVQLGPNEYIVLGDNRANSYDSKNFGPITRDMIKGKVLFK